MGQQQEKEKERERGIVCRPPPNRYLKLLPVRLFIVFVEGASPVEEIWDQRGNMLEGRERRETNERDEEEGEKGGEQQKQYQEIMAIGSGREKAVEDDDDEEEGEPSNGSLIAMKMR